MPAHSSIKLVLLTILTLMVSNVYANCQYTRCTTKAVVYKDALPFSCNACNVYQEARVATPVQGHWHEDEYEVYFAPPNVYPSTHAYDWEDVAYPVY